jgi:uncharacterized protein YkwD
MRRFARLSPLVLFVSLAAVSVPAEAAQCRGADAVINSKAPRGAARTTLCLLNAERRAHGLRPLRAEKRLRRAARSHGRDLVRYRYFSHTSRTGTRPLTRITRTGYGRGRRLVGENLAWGRAGKSSPRAIVAAWMASPSHRANILTARFREIGIGIVAGAPVGGPGGTYVTEFGG